MPNSRKRISLACTYCRYRKRKCDGQTPHCRTCRTKGLQCKYPDPDAEKEDDVPPHQTQAQHLDAIEALLQQQAESLKALENHVPAQNSSNASQAEIPAPGGPLSGISSLPTGSSNSSTHHFTSNSPLSARAAEGRSASSHNGTDKSSAPHDHLNAHPSSLGDLLKLPQVCQLIGSYAEDFFLRIENHRERLPIANAIMDSTEIRVDEETARRCFVNFSRLVHPFYPFMECMQSLARYEKTLARGLASDRDSAFTLAILAVGATAADPVDIGNQKKEAYSGDLFIQRCLRILLPLWSVSFHPDIIMCETLLLCAIYSAFTVDPMMTWRFAHMASTSIQQVLKKGTGQEHENTSDHVLVRLYWVSFLLEQDHCPGVGLPKSHMEQLTNVIPLPGYRGSDRSRGFFALADITARNILDRLLDTLTSFNQKRIEAASSAVFLCPDPSGKLAIELNSQLEAWYSALPDPIKPDLTGEEKGNQQQCQLRLRFWNIKQIIFRTLVIYWTSPDYSDYADPALEACRVCIHACREFINNAHHILSVRTPYTYSVIQSCFASAITLAIASQDKTLNQHVGDAQAIIKQALTIISPWAQGDSSVKALHDIMSVLAIKIQFGG